MTPSFDLFIHDPDARTLQNVETARSWGSTSILRFRRLCRSLQLHHPERDTNHHRPVHLLHSCVLANKAVAAQDDVERRVLGVDALDGAEPVVIANEPGRIVPPY